MMKTIARISIVTAGLALVFSAGMVGAEKESTAATAETPYTIVTLTAKIDELNKKEVALSGTILGVCKSGCKMWIAEGDYEEGKPFALVRAKDDAFKFDTDATGKKVVLRGYAVAKYLDYCSESGKEQEGAMDKCETPVDAGKTAAKESSEKPTVEEVTFFATEVEYL